MLTIIDTHPIQYRAPVYRALHQQFDIPLTVIYGSDFSVAGYQDKEFGASFAWDTDLLSGYNYHFLSQVKAGGAEVFENVTAEGLIKTLKAAATDAILVTGYHHRLYKTAIYYSWQSNCPLLLRGETTDHAYQRSVFKTWIRDSILTWLYYQCVRLLYIGERSKQHFQRLGCREYQLISSPYCVDTTSFKCDDEARSRLRVITRYALDISDSQITLLFSGKLSPRKRPDLLLEAIRHLPPDLRARVVILFLGDGELRMPLEHSSTDLNVRFLGFHNQTQLSRYYHAADLFVLPSQHSETWGLVVNEALHHGLPVIASQAVGCVPDLVIPNETGAVFETGSATCLATAIRQSIHLISSSTVRTRCRQQVSRYTVEQAAKGIAQAYQDVMEIQC